LEQQQQYRERNAEQHRTACEGLSEEQLQQHQEQNTDQMRAARAGLSVKKQQQHHEEFLNSIGQPGMNIVPNSLVKLE
jgi:hypothetical protein